MLEIIFGSSGRSPSEINLRESIEKLNSTGTLYFSYPIFEGVEEKSSADALLVSEEHGLVVFDLTAPICNDRDLNEWIEEIRSRQDEIYRKIQLKLLKNKDLVQKRNLVVNPESSRCFPRFRRKEIKMI